MKDIDRIRRSSGQMDIGSEDEGEITGILQLKGRLIVIKRRAVYQVQLPDQIDPDRSNAEIRPTQQKILSIGSESTLVQQVVLTADALFIDRYLPEIDVEAALGLAFDATADLAEASEIADKLAVEIASKQVSNALGSTVVPSVEGLSPRVKSFFQKIDHSYQRLYKIAGVFLNPDLDIRKNFFEGVKDLISERYSDRQNFVEFSKILAHNAKESRDIRSCIEHERDDQRLIISDFVLQATGLVQRPTIEIVHTRSGQPALDLAAWLPKVCEAAVNAFESMFGHLAATFAKGDPKLPLWVDRLPDDQRQKFGPRIGYVIQIGNQIVRLS